MDQYGILLDNPVPFLSLPVNRDSLGVSWTLAFAVGFKRGCESKGGQNPELLCAKNVGPAPFCSHESNFFGKTVRK